ncbi:hypothetical protein AURDEDRAFT_184953 [Auricularia subglabra TFB-10046 SS5]|nr:hypothetical protein AURDEDRAFT_184953 [Auricularia subglabra TFB-10046 SS5]
MTLLAHQADALFAYVSSVLDAEVLDTKPCVDDGCPRNNDETELRGLPRRHEVLHTIEAVLCVTQGAIAACSERWNVHTAILPPELLIASFEFLGFDDCLRVSGVSRHWRRVALSTPTLWSSFTVPFNILEGKGKLEEMLRRSQAVPLSVKLRGYHDYSPETTRTHDALRPHFPRLRALDCARSLGKPVDMPLLELLDCPERATLSRSFFGPAPQNLRVLRLRRFEMDPSCPIFHNLREFSGEFEATTSLARLLTLCPSLESLAINCASHLRLAPRPLFVALPPSLLDVSIAGIFYERNPEIDPAGAWAGHRFRLLDISCLRDMWSAFRIFESALSPSEPGWSLELRTDKTISYILKTPAMETRVTGPGYTYSLAVEAISNLQQSQLYLRRLTSLSVPLRFLCHCVEAGIELPELTDFTLTVHPKRDHKPDVPGAETATAMLVPRLQSLTFLCQADSSDTWQFTRSTVQMFFCLLPKRLHQWMRYDADLLERLALVGDIPRETLWNIDYRGSGVHALAREVVRSRFLDL